MFRELYDNNIEFDEALTAVQQENSSLHDTITEQEEQILELELVSEPTLIVMRAQLAEVYDEQIASLTNQLSSLNQTLQDESMQKGIGQHVAQLSLPERVQGSRQQGDSDMVECARTLCGHAVAVYYSNHCLTPLGARIRSVFQKGGGKPDDATAIVIQV